MDGRPLLDDQTERLRVRALELAVAGGTDFAGTGTVARARSYLDFLRGTNDAEIIGAARAFAKAVS